MPLPRDILKTDMNNGHTFHHISFPLIKRRVWDNSIAGNKRGYLRDSASGILGATLGNEATDSYAYMVNFGRDKTAFAPISANREDC